MFSLEMAWYFVSLSSSRKHPNVAWCAAGDVPILIMDLESCVTAQSKAPTTYVVIMRRRTRFMTGLAQGCDGVSARVFWMSASPAWSG